MLEHLRGLREDRELSQADMAEILDIHQTTYSDYELERINIPIAMLKRMAVFHNTSIDYILGLTDEIRPYPRANQYPPA